ncbi:Rrf2 family protein [Cytobacillus horneckiae]|uniref:Rrf2 family transcriptional regulator n=1 Tax=Cytobacillus horneckiae TaxID=549687 RepID=A0A2N0ZF23_9BACI|nr:Rrf2 family transcriptional regulator [Cytobacillus horneckiae]MBN6889524.1 Rrf2 family transcriptional regulator [Cytobacillus horneckiae]MCM3176792.1 Rrf2 family transcriptional regulator [Cytobacillus horneckiae]MEC1156632.1 Rrf2 family transcriptional regulator [Cytobacillus horneckiae]MED2939146.1 Rrf2 family transcriptional regulator [Cytobacillus horneckiae]PKG28083.1 Rrf2 family transcriptional regulator [Cytobacillus horneckiae]
MKVSSKGEYALRALITLGKNENSVTSIKEISNQTLVPIQYLEQILLLLKSHGYVKSKRGVYGGYLLKNHPKEIVIGEVIRDLEGPLAPMSCVSITAYEYCPLEDQGCLLKPLWALIREEVALILDRTTLHDILEGQLPVGRGECGKEKD